MGQEKEEEEVSKGYVLMWEILFNVGLYFAVGYLCGLIFWTEKLIAKIVGPKNYVDQNLIMLFLLYIVGQVAIFVAWPIVLPSILVYLCFKSVRRAS